jgi:hypothetical protein
MFQMAKQMKAENFRVIGIKIFWRAQTPARSSIAICCCIAVRECIVLPSFLTRCTALAVFASRGRCGTVLRLRLYFALCAPCALTGLKGGFLNINCGFGFLPPCQTGHPQVERQNVFLPAIWQKWRLMTRRLLGHTQFLLHDSGTRMTESG